MRNFNKEYRTVADEDPGAALLILMLMAGVMAVGLIFAGVLFGSYAFLWWVWLVKVGVVLAVLAIEWSIWTVVAATYRAID